MGLLQFEPIEIKEVSIVEDKKSGRSKAINIDLWFNDWKMYGFSEMKLLRLR